MVNPNVVQRVQTKIGGKKVMMFSKTTCGFCDMAKDILSKYGLTPDEYEVMELNEDPDGPAIQIYLAELTKARTVPRVFVNGHCIGGCDETRRMHQSGELKKKIEALPNEKK